MLDQMGGDKVSEESKLCCITFCFDIPKRLLSDNGTSFVNVHVQDLLNDYGVDHVKSSSYYAQGNVQAKATTKLYYVYLAEWCMKS